MEFYQPFFIANFQYLLTGIYFGLILTILAGPILVALLQTGIERGFAAGFVVGLGVWMSDLMYILTVNLGVAFILDISTNKSFELYLGIGGGIILFLFGIGTIFSPSPNIQEEVSVKKSKKALTWVGLWLKGFLINTLNPFTILFWIGVTSTIVVKKQLDTVDTYLFFTGVLGTIILTDSLKIWSAKLIKNKMKQDFMIWIRRIAGTALAVFGIVLIYRVLFL